MGNCYTADCFGNYACKNLQLVRCGAWEAEPDGCDAVDRSEIPYEACETFTEGGDCPAFKPHPLWKRLWFAFKGWQARRAEAQP